MISEDSLHEQCWLLLPWLANGRLEGAERSRVETHLRECEACAREVSAQRRLCEGLTAPERVTYAPGPSLRKLMARIDAHVPQQALVGARSRSIARAQASWRPPGVAWAATFVAAIGVAMLATLTYRWSQPLYLTHTERNSSAGDVVHIAFTPSLPVSEVSDVLHSVGARVVAGPDGSGIFGVAPLETRASAPASPSERAQLRVLAARLRADARVRWVEPLEESPLPEHP
jgi:anti-sigma factor RsiW